jgi:hypothetical protein
MLMRTRKARQRQRHTFVALFPDVLLIDFTIGLLPICPYILLSPILMIEEEEQSCSALRMEK